MGVYSQILQAVKTRLASIGPPVIVRKRSILLEGDALPTILVSPGNETIQTEAFSGVVCYDYRVSVVLIGEIGRAHV